MRRIILKQHHEKTIMPAGITLTIIFLIRMIPVFCIGMFSSKGFIDVGQADPQVYFRGAQAILQTGNNPFPFFPPLNFLFIAAFLYLGNGSSLVPITAIAIVGWLFVIGIYLLAKEVLGKKTALIAAVLCGVYPNFIFYGINFFSETLAIFWIVFAFLMVIKYFRTYKNFYLLLGGMLWGLASLTRGGLHFFSMFIIAILALEYSGPGWKSLAKPIALFLIATYLPIITIGSLVQQMQGGSVLNSKSGIGSMLHGANRITTSCADYGDIRGNIFYDINNCNEKWPEGSTLYSNELMQADTYTIISKFVTFVLQDPGTYCKNSLLKLSCFFSPNQSIIHYIKIVFRSANGIIVNAVCLGISLFYIFIILGGFWGLSLSRDFFRPVFIAFIIFYCFLIFLTVGNSKLRLPLMPFFIIYCSYFITCLRDGRWKPALSTKVVMLLMVIFLGNSIYKYREILLTPAEAQVRKIELCNTLGFPKTALYLLNQSKNHSYTDEQIRRLQKAKSFASEKFKEQADNNQKENP